MVLPLFSPGHGFCLAFRKRFTMSVTVTLLSTLCILLPFATGESCLSLEEGKAGWIRCTDNTNASSFIIWQLEKNGQFENISVCSTSSQGSNCNDVMKSRFYADFNLTTRQSVLIIANASKDAHKFRCLLEDEKMATCDVYVYVKPASPTCEPAVSDENQNIMVKCRTERAYPSVDYCSFQALNFPGSFNTSADVSIRGTDSTKYPGYRAGECTVHVNVSGVSPRDLRLIVTFSTDFMNDNKTEDRGSTGNFVPPIRLSLPSAEIAEDCPAGPSTSGKSIRTSGSPATCTCNLVDAGFPPGQVRWFHNNNAVGRYDSSNQRSTLKIVYDPKDREPRYECRAESVLAPPPQPILYSPEFAYGPPNVKLDVSHTSIDLCSGKANPDVQVICSVAHDQIKPRPLFTIIVDGQQQVTRQEGHVISTDYRYTYSYQSSSDGTHQISCRAENAAFTDQTAVAYKEIEVRGVSRRDNCESSDEAGDHSLPAIGIGVGVGVAALVIISVTIIIVVIICKRRTTATTNHHSEQGVSYINNAMANKDPYDRIDEANISQGGMLSGYGHPPPYMSESHDYAVVDDYITPVRSDIPPPCGYPGSGGKRPEAPVKDTSTSAP